MNKAQFILEMVSIMQEINPKSPYSIAIGGSNAKGTSDAHSDFDFRLYIDADLPPLALSEIGRVFMSKAKPIYEKEGFEVDGNWPRLVSFIDKEIDRWLSGTGEVIHYSWTVWGYHILTDIYQQVILDDPYDIAKKWKERLTVYPAIVKEKIIAAHLQVLQYWRHDSHFKRKVQMNDIVFISSLNAKLIHHLMQIIYAINETYYPGDGANLTLAQNFQIKPTSLSERVSSILRPSSSNNYKLYEDLIGLIDDVFIILQYQGGLHDEIK